MSSMTEADREELRRARHLLEHPGLAVKLANLAGRPVEWALARLPARGAELVDTATRAALDRALDLAVRTMAGTAEGPARDWRHRLAVWSTGGAGGALGLLGLPFELPLTTTLMLRSIADHARAQGEELSSAEARVNCLLVLALGGTASSDDASRGGYFAVRVALARAVSEAADYLAGRVAAEEVAERTAPVLIRLTSGIAARFGVAVQDKVAAQLVPVLGALGGAMINGLFIDHFQGVARGHFTVRKLERRYGAGEVKAEYAAP
jgi:hypothetical protein